MDWTHEWPTKPGFYWFYGWRFGEEEGDPLKFHYVEVWEIANGITHVTEGHFMYKTEGAEGIWQPVIFPELPSEGAERWL